jgi:hypothetical protein
LSGALYEFDDDENDYGTYRRSDYRAQNSATQAYAEGRKQETGNNRTDDTDDDVTDQTKSRSLHDNASQPPGDSANNQPDQNCNKCDFHCPLLFE